MSDSPLVSIVTPSLNQGRFIGEAIESVLRQDYPNLEYWVVDGGSSDGTLDVLRSYGDRIRWVSEADSGQAAAINKGFRRCKGSLFAWLNADDVYAPGAVEAAVRALAENPAVGLVFGEGDVVDESGSSVGRFEGTEPVCLWRLVNFLDYILQPTAFFKRDLFEKVGGLREDLHYGLDWDLWIRMAAEKELLYLPERLASTREYGGTKTRTGGWKRLRELGSIAAVHSGRFWTPGVRLYAADTAARKIGPGIPATLRRFLDGLSRRFVTRTRERLPVHSDGWMAARSFLVLPQRWKSAEVSLELPEEPSPKQVILRSVSSGSVVGKLNVSGGGRVSMRFEVPRGPEAPFVEIAVESDFSFRRESDGRRVSVRCVGLRPVG